VLDVGRDPIDAALAERGAKRHIVLTVPHFSVAPLVVAQTGLVATLSRRLAVSYARCLPVDVRETPIDLSERAVQMVWHQRSDADGGAKFFRDLIAAVAK
jgi:DNA-binding transcriptional LysR family regulator